MSRTNRKSAAALAYDDAASPDAAPRVVAKGYGLVAEMIVQRAKEAGLYVHEAPEMVSLLMQVDLDSQVPPQLYQAVAELLAWLHGLEVAGNAQAAAANGQQSAAGAAGAGRNTPDPKSLSINPFRFPALPE
ncbi:MAG: EscU/YscU/HrcU family type III secretion system export apparatus switch protein [Paraburkholderia tropica]|uniref:Flagellar biosynthesis protein n=1 Tax=Paraburkholderia tropica TaxID=92647 RepID=A0ABX5MTH1_9BURK|nr:EscU/YscU/HrcU family type III secretion system export apparatus switch protein [Paraburkholderia tropica]MBB2998469.1 flagellar biosynthesis protein [Paraburkholderia tropica]MBB6317511.1 flagellar biosynthesis protein [Paraburkholderia tropica]PXX15388.1 flagellar biosynthesis protein [Paraburkholderia tropica]PZW81069.1 flagellar biosynthesis protein [Paraburkholderia tropica]